MSSSKGVSIYNADGKILTDKTIRKIKKIIAQNKNGKITVIVEGGAIKIFNGE